MSIPRLVTLEQQQPLQAAKWLKVQVLLDSEEMCSLFQALGPFSIYLTGAILLQGQGQISHEAFLRSYQEYVENLKAGEIPDDAAFRQIFSAVFTVTPEALYALDLGDSKVIIRPSLPIIQLQLHRLGFSAVDQKFRSMVFGKDSLSWGIQFSYPQIFEDPNSRQIVDVDSNYANTALFRELQRWIRRYTLPTPFLVNDERVNVPVRLGKKCFSWINGHPQLALHHLKIKPHV